MDNNTTKFSTSDKNIIGGIHTAINSGATHDEIVNEIYSRNPKWQSGLESLKNQGKSYHIVT